MLFSLSRTKGLLLAGALTLAGLVPHLAFAQAGAQGRPDATNVQMVSVPETYCRSIDNTDMTGQDYYFSAADVTAKSGKVIQSHNGGHCCTATSPWNGTSCAAPLVCASGTEAVNGSCVATTASCAAIGMSLINGACGVAAPTIPSGTLCGSVDALRKDGGQVKPVGETTFHPVVNMALPGMNSTPFHTPEHHTACNGKLIYDPSRTPYYILCPAGYSNYKRTVIPGGYLARLGAVNNYRFQCVKD